MYLHKSRKCVQHIIQIFDMTFETVSGAYVVASISNVNTISQLNQTDCLYVYMIAEYTYLAERERNKKSFSQR